MTYAIYILVKWMLGFLMFWRLPKSNSEVLGSVRRQRVSVIIPARNEAENLPDLLASLDANSFPPLEVIVVDDSSEDDTFHVAEEAGVKVISAGRLPEGWMGKPYACWIGALKAEGEFLLFLDADTRLLPETLSALLAQYLEQGSGIVSVYPYHTNPYIYDPPLIPTAKQKIMKYSLIKQACVCDIQCGSTEL